MIHGEGGFGVVPFARCLQRDAAFAMFFQCFLIYK